MREPPVGTITLLFTDIEGSTDLARATGRGWGDVLAAHHAIVGGAIERQGGHVDRTEGDAFFATFSDARAAMAAAVDAQRRLSAATWPHGVRTVRVRMGLHTGFAERRETGYVSLEVHRAARVAAAAHGGQVLTTAATLALVSGDVEVDDLGEHRLKDFPRPERLFHVVVDGLHATAFGPLRTAQARPTNLPEDVTPLVGREKEVHELTAAFDDGARLVSLVGAGGAGKTRLALDLARRMLDDMPGGVFVVALASVTEPDEFLPAVARALGLAQADSLAEQIAERTTERPTLLVLDNFEQLLDAAPLLVDLLGRAERLRVLVTSQAPLRVHGETVVALGALAPDAATMLFVQRARAAAAGWSPGPHDDAPITEICALVGQLPLAIELAAARVAILAPGELLARLEASADVLRGGARDAPARQRSLRATFDWAHALLPQPERVLFRRMGAFAGPAPLDAVEAVAGAAALEPVEAVDALAGVLDFSLMARVESAAHGWRFTMPQALRDFARTKLSEAGEENGARRAHAEYVRAVASRSRVWYAVPESEQQPLLAIDAEVWPALAWAAAHDPLLHRELIAELGIGFARRGHIRELLGHAARAAEAIDGPLDATGSWVANCRAYGLMLAARFDEADAVLAPALEFARRAGDPREIGLLLHTQAWLRDNAAQLDAALDSARESMELLYATGDSGLQRRGLVALVQVLIDGEHFDEAEEIITARAGIIGDISTWRGDIALLRGDPHAAVEPYARSLGIAAREGDRLQTINDTNCLAAALLRAGHLVAGMEAAGIAAAMAADAGHGGFGTDSGRLGFSDTLAEGRAASGAKGEEAFERGRGVDPPARVPRLLDLARTATPGARV